jgi:hypothetical protein
MTDGKRLKAAPTASISMRRELEVFFTPSIFKKRGGMGQHKLSVYPDGLNLSVTEGGRVY